MLRLSSFKLTSNITNAARFVITQDSEMAKEPSLMLAKRGQAYFSKFNHIQACEYQMPEDIGLEISNQKNDWQLEPKLNSGENKRVIAIPK